MIEAATATMDAINAYSNAAIERVSRASRGKSDTTAPYPKRAWGCWAADVAQMRGSRHISIPIHYLCLT